jgi:spiro-SPASM protein
MTLESLESILAQVARVDDLRFTLGGTGDPLLHPRFAEILQLIAQGGIPAVHIETDLLELSDAVVQAIVASRVDVLTVHLPAVCAGTYQRVMGIDGYAQVLENLKRLLSARRALPLIVPTFTKCRENLEEMEAWYDHWLRVLGTAVITGPSDYAGQIADVAVADMSPPRRRPCARLQSRMTLHSDGVIPSCEQDILARQPMGHVQRDGLSKTWQHGFATLRADHESDRLQLRPICTACKEWHRP